MDARFRKLIRNSKRLKPALLKIGGVLEDASETAFDRQGPGWKALSPKYKKWKMKKFGSKKILERKGALSLSVFSWVRGNVVIIASGSEYAGPHQKTRPFLIISQAEVFKSKFILKKHLLMGV